GRREAGQRQMAVRGQPAAPDAYREALQLDGVVVRGELEREVVEEARIAAAGEGAVVEAQRAGERRPMARAGEHEVAGEDAFEPEHAADVLDGEAERVGAQRRAGGGVGVGGEGRVEV